MRTATVVRNTNETKISLTLNLDGKGVSDVRTGCGFLDHMLELFTRHGRFDLTLTCDGDLHVDAHHTTEDVGIALGRAFDEALQDRRGIRRYGSMILPMDESFVLCALDVSGRAYLNYDVSISAEKIGDFDTELIEEFFYAFVRNSGVTLHIKRLDGRNAHHIAEAAFKAFARALRQAVEIDMQSKDEIPSTKGVL